MGKIASKPELHSFAGSLFSHLLVIVRESKGGLKDEDYEG